MPGQRLQNHLDSERDAFALSRDTAARSAPIIQLDRLSVEYNGSPKKVAVDGLTLSVRSGEVFGFLGPNGAGKTSTMNVLLGFVLPTAGSASIFGVDVRNPIARQRIGYLPELTYYYKFLSAEELLRFYGRIFEIPRRELDARIENVLKLVELEAVRGRLIKTYSKGMQQRAGLAQALINNPDLLILDEPTSGLDPIGRMKVREIIQRLKNEGKTVFFSSHELGEVETVCDRVAILSQGRLREEGAVTDLVSKYRCNLEQVFLRVVGYSAPALAKAPEDAYGFAPGIEPITSPDRSTPPLQGTLELAAKTEV